MNPPISPIRPPVTIDGPLIPGFIPETQKKGKKKKKDSIWVSPFSDYIFVTESIGIKRRLRKMEKHRRGSRRWRRCRWWWRSVGSRESWSFRRLWWREGSDLPPGTLASPTLWCLCSFLQFLFVCSFHSQTSLRALLLWEIFSLSEYGVIEVEKLRSCSFCIGPLVEQWALYNHSLEYNP